MCLELVHLLVTCSLNLWPCPGVTSPYSPRLEQRNREKVKDIVVICEYPRHPKFGRYPENLKL